MRNWLDRVAAWLRPRPELTPEEAAELALRVFPRCC